MNKNIVGIVLIIVAAALVYFFAWPKLQPYMNTGGDAGEMTTSPVGMI